MSSGCSHIVFSANSTSQPEPPPDRPHSRQKPQRGYAPNAAAHIAQGFEAQALPAAQVPGANGGPLNFGHLATDLNEVFLSIQANGNNLTGNAKPSVIQALSEFLKAGNPTITIIEIQNLNLGNITFGQFPELESLTLQNCGIEELPPAIHFPKLSYLDVSDNDALQVLPPLPNTISWLDVSGCTGLDVSLFQSPNTPLPSELATLNISGTNIEFLPELPNTVADLDASNCPKLALPKINHLQPNHINFSRQEARCIPKGYMPPEQGTIIFGLLANESELGNLVIPQTLEQVPILSEVSNEDRKNHNLEGNKQWHLRYHTSLLQSQQSKLLSVYYALPL